MGAGAGARAGEVLGAMFCAERGRGRESRYQMRRFGRAGEHNELHLQYTGRMTDAPGTEIRRHAHLSPDTSRNTRVMVVSNSDTESSESMILSSTRWRWLCAPSDDWINDAVFPKKVCPPVNWTVASDSWAGERESWVNAATATVRSRPPTHATIGRAVRAVQLERLL